MTGLLLSFDPKCQTELVSAVTTELDRHGLVYTVAFVDTFVDPRLQISGGELIGQAILDLIEEIVEYVQGVNVCRVCGRPATWMRATQFSGNFYFCADHARQESDFGKSDDSYFHWKELALVI